MTRHKILDTIRFVDEEDQRVVFRKTSTGLVTIEMDVGTLKALGLPATISGTRWKGDVVVSLENGPTWSQKPRVANTETVL